MASHYKAVPVFGAKYRAGNEADALTHVVDVSAPYGTWQALCKRPKADSLMDDSFIYEAPADATCKTCAKRYAKHVKG